MPNLNLTDTNILTDDIGDYITKTNANNALLLFSPFYNVKLYGATGDGGTNDASAIQDAIDAAVSAGGGVVFFPSGTYLISTRLSWVGNNIKLLGEDKLTTIIRNHTDLGNNAIVYLDGSATSTTGTISASSNSLVVASASGFSIGDAIHLASAGKNATSLATKIINISGTTFTLAVNAETEITDGVVTRMIRGVTIENLTIRNGTATTDAGNSQNAIVLTYAYDITINNCCLTEIRGAYGIFFKYCSIGLCSHIQIDRFNYAGIVITIECESIRVRDCEIDTATGTGANTYGISTGSAWLLTGTYGVRNIWVHNNIVRNIPLWEAYDTHGGLNVWFYDNHAENCKVGIAITTATGYWANPVCENIFILNNTLIQGTGAANGSAITIDGDDWNLDCNIIIRDNKTKGFGQSPGGTASVGAITLYKVGNVTIENNTISEFSVTAISLYYAVLDCKIINNRITNAVGKDSFSIAYGIKGGAYGLYGVFIDHNKITYNDASKTIERGINMSAEGNVIVGQNNEINVVSNIFVGVNTGYSADPTSKYWKQGDIAFTSNLIPTRGVNAGTGIYGWLPTAVSGDGTATEYTITLTTTNDYLKFPQFANIVIAGAGTEGADLTTKVLKSNPDGTLNLANAIVTSVTGASITMVAPTFTAY